MEITELVASRSTCLRRQIGAIAVKDKRIIATGYNGAPSGMMDCIERGICIRDKNKIPSGTRGEYCCMAEGTVIKLLDGTYKKIEDIAADPFNNEWVYSFSKHPKFDGIAFGQSMFPHYVGERECVEVLLDNGGKFTCTPDHLILLKNGTYCEAGKLVPGTSLMSLTYDFSYNKKYERVNVYTCRTDADMLEFDFSTRKRWETTHQLVAKQILGIALPDNRHVIHHLNYNKTDNRPENLKLMTVGEHIALHSKNRNFPKEYYQYIGKLGRDKKREMGYTDEERAIRSRNTFRIWKDRSLEEKNRLFSTLRKNASKGASITNKDPKAIQSRKRGKILSGISRLWYLSGCTLCSANYEAFARMYPVRRKLCEKGSVAPRPEKILEFYSDIDSAIEDAKTYNHKVVSVTSVGIKKVYDISVAIFENFAIDVGANSCIFVHNCSIHGEQNLIVQAAKNGFSLNGADVYCTHKPCAICTRLLIGVGIRTVYYKHDYPDSFTDELVAGSSIKFINYSEIAK